VRTHLKCSFSWWPLDASDTHVEQNIPFAWHGPADSAYPVLVSVPHAGRNYPAAITQQSRLPVDRLRVLEDRYADLLAAGVIKAGFRSIIATAPRAWIDLNRADDDFDPSVIAAGTTRLPRPSRKTAAGLGIIPHRIGNGGDIWRRTISETEFAARLDHVYHPYHAAIAAELDRIVAQFGIAILIDLHSMPPLSTRHGEHADLVIGDAFGRSADSWLSDMAMMTAERFALKAKRNAPYAGGHSITHHGRPAHNVHAIQIEVCRSLYLDHQRIEPGPGLPRMQQVVCDLIHAIANVANRRALPLAAE
jgi:N-formylglutamate amidohydrolase